jgi:hypothetical protein
MGDMCDYDRENGRKRKERRGKGRKERLARKTGM